MTAKWDCAAGVSNTKIIGVATTALDTPLVEAWLSRVSSHELELLMSQMVGGYTAKGVAKTDTKCEIGIKGAIFIDFVDPCRSR